jgi:hypothetical protein
VNETVSAGLQLIAQEKALHATNALATGTGVMVAPNGLNLIIGIVGLCVSIGIGVKVFIEIRTQQQKLTNELLETQIKKAELATVGRRSEDK